MIWLLDTSIISIIYDQDHPFHEPVFSRLKLLDKGDVDPVYF